MFNNIHNNLELIEFNNDDTFTIFHEWSFKTERLIKWINNKLDINIQKRNYNFRDYE